MSLAPRLGSPITSIHAGERLVSVAFQDSGVRCFSHQLELVACFSLSVSVPHNSRLFWHRPTASAAYRRDECRINFHDPRTRRDAASIDVADHNVIRGRREAVVLAAEAARRRRRPFAVSDGPAGWMATAEGRGAKLWEFVAQTREFRLDAR